MVVVVEVVRLEGGEGLGGDSFVFFFDLGIRGTIWSFSMEYYQDMSGKL